MIRVNVVCEGQTEELFVRKILVPFFQTKNIFLTAKGIKGGFSYEALKHYITTILNNDRTAYITTLIDFYGMNDKYPAYKNNKDEKDIYKKVKNIEEAVYQDIITQKSHNKLFIPHFQLHEFEAMLFTNPTMIYEWLSLDKKLSEAAFQNICDKYLTPEHINDSPQTAPSKQIFKVAPFYDKTSDGISILQDIGLSEIRKHCLHFHNWMTTLEKLKKV